MRRGVQRTGDRGQKGFALLVVFLMAAAVAFTLYMEMPRVAFETAREREQLLIDRGNQYKRAIQVYYAVNKRYPAKIEDLENTNNVRFLRHRYKNPLNGKEEWRLVHTNGSFLTDSLIEKPPTQNAQNGQPGNQVPGGGPLGANNLNTNAATDSQGVNPQNPQGQQTPAPLNAAAVARPSDRPSLQNPGQNPGLVPFGRGGFGGANQNQDPNFSGGNFNPGFNPGGGRAYDPSDPSTWPAITIAAPANNQNGQQPNSQPGAPNINGAANGNFPNNGFQNGGLQNNQAVQVSPGGAFGPGQPGQPLNANGNQLNADQPGQPFGNVLPGGIPGQAPGFGGQNPQPTNLSSGNPNPNTVFNTGESQPTPTPTPAAVPSPPPAGFNPA